MTLPNVLYPFDCDMKVDENTEIPDFLIDLNLDQVIAAITEKYQEYNLKPFFYSPIHELETINYRHDIFRDLENTKVLNAIKSFTEKMVLVRRYQNTMSKMHYKYHLEGWFLETTLNYCEAVHDLVRDMMDVPIKSKGMREFISYINNYITTPAFISLQKDSLECKNDLSNIKYSIIIKGNLVKVRKYESEIDYSVEVEKTFEKFKQGDVRNYRIDLIVASGMNHVRAQIVDCVAKLYPGTFIELDNFFSNHHDFLDEVILTFDRQIHFFLSYLEYIGNLKSTGLEFCYPKVMTDKAIHARETFDIALANKQMIESSPVICNDFYLKGNERIFVVSGPNQGGKTTFARMFGQLHYLASIGCPVPGQEASLFLYDQIFTHFGKEEDIRNLRGKLQDDLIRIHNILDKATSRSIIIMNEIFTSTTLKDAVFLSKEIVQRIIQLDTLCIFVTFIDELSILGEQTVSMVSTVVPQNPTERTFKIIRLPADGLSYALCISEKHRLTYNMIKERILQ